MYGPCVCMKKKKKMARGGRERERDRKTEKRQEMRESRGSETRCRSVCVCGPTHHTTQNYT